MTITHPRRFWLFFFLSILWMVLIYVKSAETYAEQDVRPLLASCISEETLHAILPDIEFTYDGDLVSYREPYRMLEFFIRKGGHVTEYLILTLFLLGTFHATSLHPSTQLLFPGLLSLLYAASDEWHQTFVPMRTGHAIDVAVDLIGVLCAMLLVWSVRRRN
jgi:VanZ family protein